MKLSMVPTAPSFHDPFSEADAMLIQDAPHAAGPLRN
jgi:hypothetical protein